MFHIPPHKAPKETPPGQAVNGPSNEKDALREVQKLERERLETKWTPTESGQITSKK